MSQTTTGWLILIAALGMMMTLMAVDVSNLTTWNAIFTPAFIGSAMAHFGTVIAAFIGGKLIPNERDPQLRSRTGDVNFEVKPITVQVKKDETKGDKKDESDI